MNNLEEKERGVRVLVVGTTVNERIERERERDLPKL